MTQNKNNEKTIVFRLQNESSQHGLQYTIKGWEESNMYDDLQINYIESSNDNSLNEPTSIPSPFARIALAKTAFAEVAEHGKSASKVYKKIVSDCLDVAEIFFTFDKWDKQITIIEWDVNNHLENLKSDNRTKIFYKTLKTFLETDAEAFNLDRLKCIYMLKYNATGEIIGATSPCTLFFSSANPFNNDILLSNNHYAFKEIFPLHKRDKGFQKFLYAWMAQDIENTYLFPEIAKYLSKQLNEDSNWKDKIKEIGEINANPKTCIELYSTFPPDMNVEILEKDLLKQIAEESNLKFIKVSDFQIAIWDEELDNYLKNAETVPLVLPTEGGNSNKYCSWILTEIAKWDTFAAKSYYEEEWYSKKRQLPDGTAFPFLTISDFLADYLIRLPYKLNKEAFFDGNLDAGSDSSYLLPLKDTFFQFYTIDDLKNQKLGGRPMLEITEIMGGVEVILRIPVRKRNEYVVYRRVYFEAIQPNIADNDGAIVDCEFDFALFPNVKFEKEENAYYRFGLITPQKINENFSATFYNKNEKIEIESVLRNNKYHKTYGINRKKIDHIEVKDENKNATNMIVPMFPATESKSNTTQFTFAVDVGTTNTHIEYNASNIVKNAFKIENDDVQVCISDKNDDYLERETEKDFIPQFIGEENPKKEKLGRFYKFPLRTALYTLDNLDTNKSVFPFVQANIAIPYQKMIYGTNIKTQLKWSTDIKQLQYFIDSLCFMMRNKVLLNNGKLDETKIVWFYPLSMQGQKMKKLEEVWSIAYAKYFLGIDVNSYENIKEEDRLKNLISLTESEAPYLYYKNDKTKENKVLKNLSNLLSIDIGGGTTDIVFVNDKGNIDYMTSFRFAANDIFGLGDQINGLLDKYIPKIENIITEYDQSTNFEFYKLYREIKDERNKNIRGQNIATGDVASFFFSLLDNEIIKKQQIDTDRIDLHKLLKDDPEQKLIFVLFYTSIIYHIAQIMKVKELSMPRHIIFSGNGSRLVTIAGDVKLLQDLSKTILEKVGVKDAGEYPVEIIHNSINPKEVSAKGGINAANNIYEPLNYTTLVLLGTDNLELAEEKTYENVEEYQSNYVNSTISNSKQFLNMIFELLEKEKYTGGRTEEKYCEALNISKKVLRIAKEVLTESEIDFIAWTETNGIEKRIKELDDKSQQIEETFFFYPLVGFLEKLSNEIEKRDNQ